MRHLKSGRKLSRTASHRKAMFANLATSLLDKERVRTTVAKAKEIRGVVERLITFGKKGTLHAIRIAGKTLKNKDILKKLFDDIAKGYIGRQGGYTRVVKLGIRKGDNAEMAIIELVGRSDDVTRKRKKKKKAVAKKPKTTGKPATAEIEEKKEDLEKQSTVEPEDEEAKETKKPVKKKEAKKKTESKTKKEKVTKEKKEPKAKKTGEIKVAGKETKNKTSDK